jgi:pilus assembly protein Flp/PilA
VAAEDETLSCGHDSSRKAPQGDGKMKKVLRRLWRDEQGQDLVEYALLVVLVSLSAIVAMNSLASGISDAFSNAAANLT